MRKSVQLTSTCVSAGVLAISGVAQAAVVSPAASGVTAAAPEKNRPTAAADPSGAPTQCGLSDSGVQCGQPSFGCSICGLKRASPEEADGGSRHGTPAVFATPIAL